MKIEDVWNLVWLCCLSVSVRLLFILKFLKEEYTFLGTKIPYPLQPDAFYYYKVLGSFGLSKELIFWLPMIILCVGLVFYYLTLLKFTKNKGVSFLGTIGLSLFSPFLMQTYAGYVDTPVLIFALFSIFLYGCAKRKLLLCFLSMVILYFAWPGHNLIYFSILLGFVPYFYKKFNKKLMIGFVVVGIFLLYPKITTKFFAYLKYINIIKELQLMDNILYYVMFVVSLLLLPKLWKKSKFLSVNLLFYGILSILMKRWGYLAAIFIILSLILCLKPIKRPVIIIIGVITILSCFSVYNALNNATPLITREDETALRSLEEREVYSNWANGHVFQYFVKGNVMSKAHPSNEILDLWPKILDGKQTNGYMILDKHDLKRYKGNQSIIYSSSRIRILD